MYIRACVSGLHAYICMDTNKAISQVRLVAICLCIKTHVYMFIRVCVLGVHVCI